MSGQEINEALLNLAKSLSDNRERQQREADLKKQRDSLNAISKSLISVDFDSSRSLDLIKKHIDLYERFLYSEISNFIYNIEDAERKNLLQNIEKILSLCNKDDFRTILKLYDHVNLAINQLSLKQGRKEFQEQFKEHFDQEISPVWEQTKQEIQSASKSISSQLISMVSIFTAIAFVVFGGISSLENIFTNINEASILKLCILGSIWGLCLLGLISLFMRFVLILAKPDHGDTIQNDRVTILVARILIYTLIISLGTYVFINYTGSWLFNWTQTHKQCASIILILLILFAVIISTILVRKNDQS